MNALLKNWVMAITCASIVAACLESMVPEGGTRRVVRLVAGLLLMGAVLHPLAGLKPMLEDTAGLGVLSQEWENMVQNTEAGGNALLKSIIEERVAAYILDKATEWGMTCGVTVFCRYDDGNGLYYPEAVEISGSMTTEQKKVLSAFITEEIAISAQRQTYTSEVE